MKDLTTLEMKEVSGGNPVLYYFVNMAVDAFIEQASETHDMFQNSNMSLPYNRL